MTYVDSGHRWTLLDIVNHILNSTDSEPVNSISDTVEAEQVTEVVKGTFYNIVSNRNWETHHVVFKLHGYGDDNYPTHMKLPTNITKLLSLNYSNTAASDVYQYRPVTYLSPTEFLSLTNTRSTLPNSAVIEDYANDAMITILTDRGPTYYTSFDDKTLIFDSYDKSLSDTLTRSRTQCTGVAFPAFYAEDDFVPDLPEKAMMYLIEESKSASSLLLRQELDQKAEQRSIRHRRYLSQDSWQVHGGLQLPDYGRRTAYRRSPHFPPKR